MDPNDSSLVLRADFPAFSALLMGDTNLEGERVLPVDLLDVDVLKVGHHGSKTSSGADFLTSVSPKVALISVGKGNKYHHPTSEALQRLLTAGAAIYRTDQRGSITVKKVSGVLSVSHDP